MYRNDLIVKAMEDQGKTNESLAHETGLSHATVSAVRNGNEQVRLETLRLIAKALGLEMRALFSEPKTARAT
jgi:transcriptional regulator with XRE-family HTH domain